MVPTTGAVQAVHGGEVSGWETGLAVEPPLPDQRHVGAWELSDVTFRDNVTAANSRTLGQMGGYDGTLTVTGSHFEGNGLAFTSTPWGVIVAEDSTFVDNDAVAGSGESTVTIRRSELRGNDVVVEFIGYGSIRIEDSLLVDNRVVDPGRRQVGDLYVSGSTIRGSDVVIAPTPDQSNTFLRENLIADNVVAVDLGTGQGDVVGNTFTGNGVALRSAGVDLRVVDNVLERNGDALVSTGSPEVGGNRVTDNAGWGIHAPGAIDLGGNVAFANGRRPQCLGVVCASRPRS